jgi:signal transduction histidine kinase/CheY-like chemotaxis protein
MRAMKSSASLTRRFFVPEDVDRRLPEKELGTAFDVGRCEVEGWRVRKDGSRFWSHSLVSALHDEQGRLQGYAKIMHDETDRKRLEDLHREKTEADLACRAKSEFLATMSHELRTPLNGVIGMIELLLGTSLDARQRRYASLVKASGDSLLALINDVLDFSKIEAGKVDLEQTEFDLHYAVEGVTSSFAARVEEKGLELLVGVHPAIPTKVRGDPGRLQQVLMNLVNNAIKFTRRGEVVVRASLESQTDDLVTVRFTVADTGIGIPRDRLACLFESFSQVDASTTRRFGGTGLGLAISKRLVELMGGEIGVESEEGIGSTFWFTVSFGRYSDEEAVEHFLHDLHELRVLVVDDNETNCEILCEQLNSWGLINRSVTDGPAALTALRGAAKTRTPFSVAILDMHMPTMDGLALARAIKSDPAIADTALILLSSLQTDERPSSSNTDFVGRLTKPVRPSHLLDTLANVLTCRTHGEHVATAPGA